MEGGGGGTSTGPVRIGRNRSTPIDVTRRRLIHRLASAAQPVDIIVPNQKNDNIVERSCSYAEAIPESGRIAKSGTGWH